ncbi:MAG: glycoside hydrolase family 15 protein [Hyphomicrobiaceae bacterium]|nr:glycoside hydrolase family 15 protein [Hyphomicrobiaceae bacterium]
MHDAAHRTSEPLAAPFADAPAEPEISDYAIIGDCRTAALVSIAGSINWLCLPDFSSPSVFAELIDPGRGGSFLVRPAQVFVAKRRYIPNTPVLETTFETETGSAKLLDFFPVVDGVHPMGPMREVLRIIEGGQGEIELGIGIDVQPDYRRSTPRLRHRGELGWCWTWANQILVLRSDVALAPGESGLTGSVTMRRGERRYLSLSYTRSDPAVLPLLGRSADGRLAQTIAWWQEWAGRCTYRGPHREAVLRSAITLKLLTYCLSSAIVAAPTTSLPESIGGDRNWDYRYCWLRDAGLTNNALVRLGYFDEARGFLGWMLHATRLTWPELRIVYDLVGRTELEEVVLPHLAGYRGSRPVRIGNGAFAQRQLDVYGEVAMAAEAVVGAGCSLDAVEARMLAGFGDVVCNQWQEPDSGIWEIRGPQRQYTFSKVMCWAAMDRLLKLHDRGAISLRSSVDRFRRVRQEIEQVIETRGFNQELESYTSELDGDRVDAALLLMACIGYKDASDPRMVSTFRLIHERLGRNGLIHRYEPGYDGFGSEEAAFGICSFWAVDNLAKRGETAAAERAFEHLLGFANDVGLFAEEIDVSTGAAIGNFPQAFTHVGLINVALAIEKSRQEAPPCRD